MNNTRDGTNSTPKPAFKKKKTQIIYNGDGNFSNQLQFPIPFLYICAYVCFHCFTYKCMESCATLNEFKGFMLIACQLFDYMST